MNNNNQPTDHKNTGSPTGKAAEPGVPRNATQKGDTDKDKNQVKVLRYDLTLGEALAHRPITVSKYDDDVIALAKGFGYRVLCVDEKINPHGASALFRAVGRRVLYSEAVTSCQNILVLAPSKGELDLIEYCRKWRPSAFLQMGGRFAYLNKEELKRVLETTKDPGHRKVINEAIKKLPDKWDCPTFYPYRPKLYPGDLAHGRGLHELPAGAQPRDLGIDGVIMCDIYELSVEELAVHIDLWERDVKMFWLLRDFRGTADWEKYTVSGDGKSRTVTGAMWVRNLDQLYFCASYGRGGDGSYCHAWRCGYLFDLLCGTIEMTAAETEVEGPISWRFETHVTQSFGPFCYGHTVFSQGKVETQESLRPILAEVVGGRWRALDSFHPEGSAVGKPASADSRRAGVLALEASMNNLLPPGSPVRRWEPMAAILAEAERLAWLRMTSSAKFVDKDDVLITHDDASDMWRGLRFHQKTGLPLWAAEHYAKLTKAQPLGDFLGSVWAALKDLLSRLYDAFVGLWSADRAALELNVISLFTKWAAGTNSYRKFKMFLNELGFIKNLGARRVTFAAQHPFITELGQIMFEVAYQLASATWEEWAKRQHAIITAVLSVGEFVLRAGLTHDSAAVTGVIYHLLLTFIPLPIAIFGHFLTNLYETNVTSRALNLASAVYQMFLKKSVNEEEVEMEDSSSATWSQIAGYDLSGFQVRFGGTDWREAATCLQQLEELEEKEEKQRVMLIDSDAGRSMAKVARTSANTLLMYALRFKAPSPQPTPGFWNMASAQVRQLLLPVQYTELTLNDVLNHLKGKIRPLRYQQYVTAATEIQREHDQLKPEAAMVKSDETLPLKPDGRGAWYTKVRAVTNVPPKNHMQFMQHSIPLIKATVEYLNRTIFRHGNLHYSYSIPYGWNAVDLDNWVMQRRLKDGIHVVFLCDDLFILVVAGNFVRACAVDQRRFDKTCGKEAQHAKVAYYLAKGMPTKLTDEMLSQCSGKRYVRLSKEVEGVFEVEWMTPTGYADTSGGGSIMHLHPIHAAVLRTLEEVDGRVLDIEGCLGEHLSDCFRSAGFEPEWEGEPMSFGPLSSRTFLGGRFVNNADDWQWVPVSSIKMLGTKKDFATFEKQTGLAGRGRDYVLFLYSQPNANTRDPFWAAMQSVYRRAMKDQDTAWMTEMVDYELWNDAFIGAQYWWADIRRIPDGEGEPCNVLAMANANHQLGEAKNVPFDTGNWLAAVAALHTMPIVPGCDLPIPVAPEVEIALKWYRSVHYGVL